jgi:nucleotide-binding universal stress UspA family protein
LLRQAEKGLEQTLAAEFEGITVERLLRKGDPAECIIQLARDQKADLIVMPTHGYGTFRRFLLGSVTAKVLHDFEGPVWTVTHIQEASLGAFALRHVLCAVDFGTHSARTLRSAADIASEFGARLSLIHVTPVPEPDEFSYATDPAWQDLLAKAANESAARLQHEAGTKVETIIRSGTVSKALSRASQELGADLLVIGRPHGARLRASGYGIIRESHIPVLSV